MNKFDIGFFGEMSWRNEICGCLIPHDDEEFGRRKSNTIY